MAGKHDSLISLFTPTDRTSLSHFASTKTCVHCSDTNFRTYCAQSIERIRGRQVWLSPLYPCIALLHNPLICVSVYLLVAALCGPYRYLMVHVMDNVLTKVRFWRYDGGVWVAEDRVWQLPNMAELSAWSINADTSDAIWMTSSGYTQPTSLYYGSAADAEPPLGTRIKRLPGQFDAEGLVVEQ
jgi:hypothetical protein